jgi:hypothetical protein
MLRDESGQVLRHVISIGVVVAVLVLVMSEVGPIVWFRISSIQDAEDIANAAAVEYRLYKNEGQAMSEVMAKMKAMGFSDEEMRQSTVLFLPLNAPEKTMVQVTVVRYANTLVTRHINPLKKFARVATTKQASVTTATQTP